jgi:hypothetical protein
MTDLLTIAADQCEEIDRLRRQRDELAALLMEIRDGYPDELIPLERCRGDDYMDIMGHKIEAALAKVGGA